jgi:hypothetical protein
MPSTPLVRELELLGPWMELDASSAGVDGPARLCDRLHNRIHAAERHEPPSRVGRRRDDVVVRGRVAGGLLHRDDYHVRAHGLQFREQLRTESLKPSGSFTPTWVWMSNSDASGTAARTRARTTE